MPRENKIQIIKYAPPPPDLPMLGRVDPKEVSFIGRTNYVAALEEKRYIFGVKRVDRRRHLYIIGKSGVGKSKLLELLIRQDIAYGHGLCLIDPHGDVIDAILDFIPKERVEDVCLIDPSDAHFPASFNPLSNIDPGFKHQLTQGLIEVMEKQFGANWTPRLEHAIIPLVNKLGQFLSDPMLRNIFGQKENKINLEELMNQKKLLFINLSKGRLGEENASFFGSMFITKIKQAGMARASLPESERNDFYLYVDEFHNLVTETFENLLSEARKYGLCLTMAHQYVSQLIHSVQAAVLGNVGSIIIFRVGGEDALKLKPEMAPIFDTKDMINLGMQEFYIKMTIDGETYDPFSAETLKILTPPHRSYKQEILEASRRKYTIPADAAKKLIAEEEATIIRSGDEKTMITGKKEIQTETVIENKSDSAPQEKQEGGGAPMI